MTLSRALLGQWSKVGSLGKVYVIIVDTFEEKKGEWPPFTIWILQFTVYCKSQQFQSMPIFNDSAPFVE